jgi:hypothetical protein
MANHGKEEQRSSAGKAPGIDRPVRKKPLSQRMPDLECGIPIKK